MINPTYAPNEKESGTPSLIEVHAMFYFAAADEYGSPAWSPDQIAGAQEVTRHNADVTLASAEEIAPAPVSGGWSETATAGARCATFDGSAGKQVQLATGANTIEVAPGDDARLRLRRFAANEFPAVVGTVNGGSVAELKIPEDEASASYPWHLLVEGGQQVRICLPR